MRYRFNKLTNINSIFGPSNGRSITYVYIGDLGLGTDKYAYNIIPVNLGLEKIWLLKATSIL